MAVTDEKRIPTEFHAEMTCEGCAAAITRIVKKIEGVEDIECSIEKQTVLVYGSVDPQQVLEKLQKWVGNHNHNQSHQHFFFSLYVYFAFMFPSLSLCQSVASNKKVSLVEKS
eukprot:GHVQ01024111.1.p1 GENE.GHVQ01024111.1~~GHVQ01024111.1.p1  ORF type:complete len:113 (+),score=19.74 GHVQ01024111.1:322-660(+)